MGKQIHKLSNVDMVNKTATCSTCGPVSIYTNNCGGRYCRIGRLDGKREYRRTHLELHVTIGTSGNHKKLDYCQTCGFIAADSCQLDIDHIDGNRENGSPDNIQTLCANCHRLKSRQNNDNHRYSAGSKIIRKYAGTILRKNISPAF